MPANGTRSQGRSRHGRRCPGPAGPRFSRPVPNIRNVVPRRVDTSRATRRAPRRAQEPFRTQTSGAAQVRNCRGRPDPRWRVTTGLSGNGNCHCSHPLRAASPLPRGAEVETFMRVRPGHLAPRVLSGRGLGRDAARASGLHPHVACTIWGARRNERPATRQSSSSLWAVVGPSSMVPVESLAQDGSLCIAPEGPAL